MQRLRLALPSARRKLHICFMVYPRNSMGMKNLHSFHHHQFLPHRPPLPQGAGGGLGAAAQPRNSCQDRNTSRVIQQCLCPLPEQGAACQGLFTSSQSARQLVLGSEFPQQHLLPVGRRWAGRGQDILQQGPPWAAGICSTCWSPSLGQHMQP